MIVELLLLLAGFGALVGGAYLLIEGAVAIAKKYNISELIIGLTIVAFGTSAPEFFVSLISTIKKSPDILIGNIIGSNVMNIALILGISGIIRTLKIEKSTEKFEVPFLLIISIILTLFASNNFITLKEGILFIILFAGFLYYCYINRTPPVAEELHAKKLSLFVAGLFILIGSLFLACGGDLTVEAVKKLAKRFGISETVIAITVVALGTSLPELVTSIIAVIKKRTKITVGNIVGSNIFNTLLCTGIPATIKTIKLDFKKEIVNFGMLLLVTLLIWIFSITGKKISKIESSIFILVYIGYILYLFLIR